MSTSVSEIPVATEFSQRWRARRHSWRHLREADAFDRRKYEIGPIDQASARTYVEANHYSGRMPAPKAQWGMWEIESARLVGVLALTTPMRSEVLTNPFPSLVPFEEAAELGRLVLDPSVPANGESFFVAESFHQAQRIGFRGIVSFADPVARVLTSGRVVLPGHAGTIYQALSGIPAGRSKRRTLRMFPDDGTIFSERGQSKVRKQDSRHDGSEALLIARGMPPLHAGEDSRAWLREGIDRYTVPLKHGGNWRYCFVLGSERERRALRAEIPLRRFLGLADGAELAPLHVYYPKKNPLPGQVAA